MQTLIEETKEKTVVPCLRFNQFTDVWEKKSLGEVSIFLDGKRKPIKSQDRSKMKGPYPYYGASGIIDYVNNFLFDEEIILLGEDGENIVSRNLPLAFRVSGKCWVNNHAHVIKPNSDTHIDFLTIVLERTNYEAYNTGTAQPKLNQEVCKRIPLMFPSFEEQQKIASFLSAVDKKIALLKRKKELLEQYKKGVMQQLFSRKLRFKDEKGKEFPEWEEKKLGDLGDFIGGGTPNTNNKNYWIGNIPWISSSDISENDIYNIDIKKHINKDAINESATKIIPKDSVLLISRVGVGKLAINKIEICTSQDFTNFTPHMDNPYFIGYYLIHYKNILSNLSQGTSIKGFTTDDAKNVRVYLPVKEEQDKICNLIYWIDQQIFALILQTDKVNCFKKSLLQQMFV